MAAPSVFAQDPAPNWPPTLDTKSTVTKTLDGRPIEHYVHGPRDSWGYPDKPEEWAFHPAGEIFPGGQNHNTFYLVPPEKPRDNAPLCVVLHSANRTAYIYLGFTFLGQKADGVTDPATVMTQSRNDCYTLFLNSTNDEWWGWNAARNGADYKNKINSPPPTEKRVLDTIEWVVQQRHIDRNRIYLTGLSMGGCGALGIGLPNGNIFASIRVTVPAGTAYGSYRFAGVDGFGPIPALDAPTADLDAWKKRAAGVGMPDPPVICDFSSQDDGWSVTEPPLVSAALYGKLPLILTWGKFGHTTFAERLMPETICQVGLVYPWMEIVKNEAYAVFTRATCDQRNPWINGPVEFDNSGVMNAYFRWKSTTDTATNFKMQLWIDHPQIPGPVAIAGRPPGPAVTMPDTALADVTFRRLQQFKVHPGKTYAYKITQDGKTLACGTTTPDLANLLTIPQVQLGLKPVEVELSVK